MLTRPGEGDSQTEGARYVFEHGKRRGETFDLKLQICTHPLCACTNLRLVCTPGELPEGVTAAGLHVNLDVFERKSVRHESGDRVSRALGRALARDLGDEDWEALQRHFLGAKLRLTREADLASFDDADFPHEEIESESLLVAYGQAVPFDRSLLIEAGGQRFVVDDLYCLRSHCRCREVHLYFLPIAPDETAHRRPVDDSFEETCIVLDLARGRWRLEEQGTIAVDAATLMAAFFDQLRPTAMLKERRRVLRAMYQRYLRRIGRAPAPGAVQVKVGRNDPCPCGSGKKYKKCCLPKELGR